MANNRTHVVLRRMVMSDVDQVVTIDKAAFSTPWPPRTYRYEIANDRSIMLVLQSSDLDSPAPLRENGVLGRLKQYLVPPPTAAHTSAAVIAYSGFWYVADEAHISTIAVHPDWRGRKLGELLLWSMIRQAMRQQAAHVTLEVRVSNSLAQNLYRKYGFKINRRRKGYYRDDGEDAYEMILAPLDGAYRERLLTFGQELSKHLKVKDNI